MGRDGVNVKIGDKVKCNPEEPEHCGGKARQIGNVVSILEGFDTWGYTVHVKVKFDDNSFLFFYPSELEVIE